MHIFAVTPIHVGADELARRQARYDDLAPDGITVELADLDPSAPRTFDSLEAIEASDELVAEALRNHPANADALLPDCVLDPGVHLLNGKVDIPVFGMLRLALTWHSLAGRTMNAVTRNEPIAEEMRRQAALTVNAETLGTVQVLDLGFDAVADNTAWITALGGAMDAAERAGAKVLFNGCSAVDLPASVAAHAVRVLDPTAQALCLIAAGETA